MPKITLSKNTNVEETAAFLDAILTRGLRVSKDSERVRPARMSDVQNYLKVRGFVGADGQGSPTVFADSLGIKYGMDQAFANGVLLNWGSEIGALKDLLVRGGDITEHYRNRKLGRQMLELERPVGALGAEAAGALVPSIGMGLPAEAAAIQRGMRPLRATAAIGAVEGGAYGLGSDGGAFERMVAMMMSAGVGAGGAAAAYGLTTLFGQLKQVVAKQLGVQSKEGQAADIAMESVRADKSELTQQPYAGADDAIAELAMRRQVAPGSRPTFADLGEETRLTGQAILEGGSPEQRSSAISMLRERQMGARDPNTFVRSGGQGERITQAFEEGVGIPAASIDSTIDLLQDATRRESRYAYNSAYRQSPIDDRTVNRRMLLSDYQDAYRSGYALSVKEARVDPETPVLRTPPEEGPLLPPYTIAELDYTSRGLKDTIAMYGTEGRGPQAKRAATMDVQAFLKDIDELSPEFRAARQTYAIGTTAEDALEDGYTVMRKRPRKIEYDLEKLSEGERKYYKIGAAQAMFEFLEKEGYGKNIGLMLDQKPEHLKRIEILFGNEGNFRSFMKRIITEMEGSRTASSLAGSQTARLQAKQSQIGIAPGGEMGVDAAGALVTAPLTTPTSSVGQIAGRALDVATLKPLKRRGAKRVSDALGRVMFEEDPALQALKLQTMQRLAGKRSYQRGLYRGGGGLLGLSGILPALNE